MLKWLEPGDPFPPVERALREPNGLLCAGADLSVGRLLEAYPRTERARGYLEDPRFAHHFNTDACWREAQPEIRAAYDAMVEKTVTHLQETGSITLAQVRDLFSTSRKYAQAFLEHLDALKVTRRQGDARVLRQRP